MKLTPGEKLILLAFADAAKPSENRELDLGYVRDAILDGHLWALDWDMFFISERNDTPVEVANETAEILTMWRNIEMSVARLPQAELDEVQKVASPYSLKFQGFDANNDKHYSVARFMVEKMNRFEELSGRYLNSHSEASLPKYRDMLPRYQAVMEAKSA